MATSGSSTCSPVARGVLGFLIVVNLMVFVLRSSSTSSRSPSSWCRWWAHRLQARIDPIWFGVMLARQHADPFMHPPFGFALFLPEERRAESIRTADIYWGAIPFLVIQLFMVAVVLAFRRWCCATRRRMPAASPKSRSTSIPTPATLPAEWR